MLPVSAIGSTSYRNRWGMRSPRPTTVDDPSMQHFTIHRLDKTVANGSKFATIQEVRAHLEEIAKLPLWRRDPEIDSNGYLAVTKHTGPFRCRLEIQLCSPTATFSRVGAVQIGAT